MLMMFGSALRKAPFERAMPFNDSDLMVLINDEYGFRMCNITTEDGERFGIKNFMISDKEMFGKKPVDIFGKTPFDQRVKEFGDIFVGRVERFFETKKSDYIFFDLEEQKYLRKLMSKKGLSCSIELYKYSKDKSPEKIEFLDLPYNDAMMITKFLSSCKIRAVLNCREYYYASKSNHDKNKERYSKYSNFTGKKDDKMDFFFARYKQLKTFTSKEKVDKYFKLLTVKYHPDKEGGDTEICSTIRSDFGTIKESRWYINLKDKEDGGDK